MYSVSVYHGRGTLRGYSEHFPTLAKATCVFHKVVGQEIGTAAVCVLLGKVSGENSATTLAAKEVDDHWVKFHRAYYEEQAK